MIIRPKSILSGGMHPNDIRACVQEFLTAVPRMDRLWDAFQGRHDILNRRRASGMPNSRLVNDFPRYISTLAAGYLIGKPIAYETDPDQSSALDGIVQCYRRSSIDSVDAELARQASIFGRGVELVFSDEDAQPRSVALDPRRAFVVYDDTVENRPLMGIHILPKLDRAGRAESWRIRVYTDCEILTFACPSPGDVGKVESRIPHFFEGVPMTEYWNGEDERGDFEGVMTLIDAYDMLQSDRVNDKRQFVDALLLLYGCTMENDASGRSPGQQLREDKVLALPDADARAEWLCKQLNESDTEVLKDALAKDIHKLSMVPDLTDDSFAGNLSGVAMRYKLLGLDQLTQIKERWFREALTDRMARYQSFLSLKGAPALDVSRVRMTFTRALPMNRLDEARAVESLSGILPNDELTRRAEAIL